MQLEEIKDAVAEISADDRLALKAYLLHLDHVASPDNARLLSEANQRIDDGDYYTLAQLREASAALEAQGR